MQSDLSNRLRADQKRVIKDKLVKYSISSGGALVLVTLLLIFGYLLYVVLPIFAPVSIEVDKQFTKTQNEQLSALGLDEQNDISFQVTEQGTLSFHSMRDRDLGKLLLTKEMLNQPVAFAQSSPSSNTFLFSNQFGQVTIFKPEFETSYPNDKRLITPIISYPLGESLIDIDPQGKTITHASFEISDEQGAIVALTSDNRGLFISLTAEEDMMTEQVVWEQLLIELPSLPSNISQLLLSPDLNNLFVRSGDELLVYDISDVSDVRVKSALTINAKDSHVTNMQLLTGASSLIVANENGVISQWFEVLKDNKRTFTFIRDFDAETSLSSIVPEYFRKGFLTTDKQGYLSIFHTTGNTRLLKEKLTDNNSLSVAFSPRANALLVVDADQITLFHLDNEHPEITWSALWQKVWYEGYPEPDYLWQSTSASDDFEA
ncbi:MAG: phosphate ABC transporter permease, partial [Psychromonas sp.]|nr:phosphate ABC transporter permease [Psychromonas sp.]